MGGREHYPYRNRTRRILLLPFFFLFASNKLLNNCLKRLKRLEVLPGTLLSECEVLVELERVDLGKMNLQLVAKEENQHRAQRGKNQAGGLCFVNRMVLRTKSLSVVPAELM